MLIGLNSRHISHMLVENALTLTHLMSQSHLAHKAVMHNADKYTAP